MKRRSLAAAAAVIVFSSTLAYGGSGHAHPAQEGRTAVTRSVASQSSKAFEEALQGYNRAFQARDLDALRRIFAEDVVMYEQGTQNVGRQDVLDNHLGPELRDFQELTARYGDIRIRESKDVAVVTRTFSIQATKRSGQFFRIRGTETQGWVLKGDRWELAHLHLSFPPR